MVFRAAEMRVTVGNGFRLRDEQSAARTAHHSIPVSAPGTRALSTRPRLGRQQPVDKQDEQQEKQQADHCRLVLHDYCVNCSALKINEKFGETAFAAGTCKRRTQSPKASPEQTGNINEST
jgi:hypothetical protein